LISLRSTPAFQGSRAACGSESDDQTTTCTTLLQSSEYRGCLAAPAGRGNRRGSGEAVCGRAARLYVAHVYGQAHAVVIGRMASSEPIWVPGRNAERPRKKLGWGETGVLTEK
jgi:hypothetical protein